MQALTKLVDALKTAGINVSGGNYIGLFTLAAPMSAHQRIYEMLSQANSDSRTFPATIFYNEGWLLRLVLDWFCRNSMDATH